MAKQTGLLKYSGNLGGISHYKIKGLKGDFARLGVGPSAEEIATSPKYKRTRENNKEFGGSAKVGKAFRLGLSDVVKSMGDRYITSRMTKIFKQINIEGVGVRGQRPFDVAANKDKLADLEFNKDLGFNSVFNIPFAVTVDSADRNATTLVIQDANASDKIYSPVGATHFKLIHTISVISNYAYDTTSTLYEATNTANNGLSQSVDSGFIPVNGSIGSITTLANALPGAGIVLGADQTLIATLGIEFYQEIGSDYYLFAQGNCAKVIDIF